MAEGILSQETGMVLTGMAKTDKKTSGQTAPSARYRRELSGASVQVELRKLDEDMDLSAGRANAELERCFHWAEDNKECWDAFREAYQAEVTDAAARIETGGRLRYNSEYALRELLSASGERSRMAAKCRYLFARTWEAAVFLLREQRERWAYMTGNGLTFDEEYGLERSRCLYWYDVHIRPKYEDTSRGLPVAQEEIRRDYEVALYRRNSSAVRFLVQEMEERGMFQDTVLTGRFAELYHLGSMTYPLPHPEKVRADIRWAAIKGDLNKKDYYAGCLPQSILAWGEGESLGELLGRSGAPDGLFDTEDAVLGRLSEVLSALGDEMVLGGRWMLVQWEKLMKQTLQHEKEILEICLK